MVRATLVPLLLLLLLLALSVDANPTLCHLCRTRLHDMLSYPLRTRAHFFSVCGDLIDLLVAERCPLWDPLANLV